MSFDHCVAEWRSKSLELNGTLFVFYGGLGFVIFFLPFFLFIVYCFGLVRNGIVLHFSVFQS